MSNLKEETKIKYIIQNDVINLEFRIFFLLPEKCFIS